MIHTSVRVHFECLPKPPSDRIRSGTRYPTMAQIKDFGDRCSFDLAWPVHGLIVKNNDEEEEAEPGPVVPALLLEASCPPSLDIGPVRADFCQDAKWHTWNGSRLRMLLGAVAPDKCARSRRREASGTSAISLERWTAAFSPPSSPRSSCESSSSASSAASSLFL